MKKTISIENNLLTDLIGDDYLVDYGTLNSTEKAYPKITLTELFRQQAEITPNNTVLEFHDSKITYDELHKKVN